MDCDSLFRPSSQFVASVLRGPSRGSLEWTVLLSTPYLIIYYYFYWRAGLLQKVYLDSCQHTAPILLPTILLFFHKADAMNEIAMHSAEEKSWWIPGKYWPNLYLVKLLDWGRGMWTGRGHRINFFSSFFRRWLSNQHYGMHLISIGCWRQSVKRRNQILDADLSTARSNAK